MVGSNAIAKARGKQSSPKAGYFIQSRVPGDRVEFEEVYVYGPTHRSDEGIVATKNQLGVRVPPDSPADVTPDAEGYVAPGRGMSVAPAWGKLPFFLIPERLKGKVPKARGDDQLRVWRHGEGAFADGSINGQLALSRTTARHGEVEPASRTLLGDYQATLAATKNDWEWDEA